MIDREKLHAWVDGELQASERAEVEAAIASNADLAAELQSIHALKNCLQTHIEPVKNEDAWKECVKRLDAIDKTRKAEIFVGKYAWALCAVFFVAIFSGGMLNRMNGANRIGTSDVAVMDSNLAYVGLPRASSAEGIKTWLKGLLGREPAAVPYKDELKVVGGFRGVVEGYTVVKLNLRDSQGPLALVLMPDVQSMEGLNQMDGNFSVGRVGEMNCVAWTHDNMFVILVGDRTPESLRSVARSFDPTTR